MTYNIRKEQAAISATVAEILAAEKTLSADSVEWARETRGPELEGQMTHLREEVCYLLALWEAVEAEGNRGWDFDPEYALA